jgi:hypothetical protein
MDNFLETYNLSNWNEKDINNPKQIYNNQCPEKVDTEESHSA